MKYLQYCIALILLYLVAACDLRHEQNAVAEAHVYELLEQAADQSDYSEAIVLATKAVQLATEYQLVQYLSPAYNALGTYALGSNDYATASTNFFNAIEYERHDVTHTAYAHYNLGLIYSRLENYPFAINFFEQAELRYIEFGDGTYAAKAQYELGFCHYKQANTTKAIAYTTQALNGALDNNQTGVAYKAIDLLTRLHIQAGNHGLARQANEQLQQLVHSNPQKIQLMYALGNIRIAMGRQQTQAVITGFETTLALLTTNPTDYQYLPVHSEYADFLRTQGRKAEAAQVAEAALAAAPAPQGYSQVHIYMYQQLAKHYGQAGNTGRANQYNQLVAQQLVPRNAQLSAMLRQAQLKQVQVAREHHQMLHASPSPLRRIPWLPWALCGFLLCLIAGIALFYAVQHRRVLATTTTAAAIQTTSILHRLAHAGAQLRTLLLRGNNPVTTSLNGSKHYRSNGQQVPLNTSPMTEAERRETMWDVLEQEYTLHLEYLDLLTDDDIERIKTLVRHRGSENK